MDSVRLVRELDAKGIREGDLVSVVLVEGASFNMATSSYPCAYASDKSFKGAGFPVSGHLCGKQASNPGQGVEYLDLTPSGAVAVGRPRVQGLSLGGYRIMAETIHSFEKMVPEKRDFRRPL